MWGCVLTMGSLLLLCRFFIHGSRCVFLSGAYKGRRYSFRVVRLCELSRFSCGWVGFLVLHTLICAIMAVGQGGGERFSIQRVGVPFFMLRRLLCCRLRARRRYPWSVEGSPLRCTPVRSRMLLEFWFFFLVFLVRGRLAFRI